MTTTLPHQTITINDPGLGLVDLANTTMVFIGNCSLAPSGLQTISNVTSAVDTLGYGPLTEAVCSTLSAPNAGGPVYAYHVAHTGQSNSAVTNVNTGTGTVTVAGTALDTYNVVITITTAGTLGAGVFTYSLDGGATTSQPIVIPGGGTYLLTGTGITATFVPGAGPSYFAAGATHSFTTSCGYFSAAALTAAMTAIQAAPPAGEACIVLCGRASSSANAVLVFSALDTALTTAESNFQFLGAIMNAGIDIDATIATAFDAVSSKRILVVADQCTMTSARPFAGYGSPKVPAQNAVAARIAGNLPSTDLARVASGSLYAVTAISRDEYLTPALDIHKICTLRTWVGKSGFYVTQGKLKSPGGSDFKYWQHRRLMDIACAQTVTSQTDFIGVGVRTNSDGTIDKRDASRFETKVLSDLKAQLTAPQNAEGTGGHVSAVGYVIDRTNNIVVSETLQAQVSIRPLGYPKNISTTIGFSLTV